jgi:hypothetical protein
VGAWETSHDVLQGIAEMAHGGQTCVDIWRHDPTKELDTAKVGIDGNPWRAVCERIVTDARMLIRLNQPALLHGCDVFLPTRPGESLG